MPKLERYQMRVWVEFIDLNTKIDDLKKFLGGERFSGIGGQFQDLLIEQLGAMEEYSDILEKRLKLWGVDTSLPE